MPNKKCHAGIDKSSCNKNIQLAFIQAGKAEMILKYCKMKKALLENISGQSINQSRQHYIRFNLPDGYRRLTDASITDDYSMGYGSINGFRASVAASFYWYDLEKEEQTSLRIHPFCFMEANSFYEQKFSAIQALEELMHYLNICKAVNGQLITIWHNNFLGTAKAFAGWKETYAAFIAQVSAMIFCLLFFML